MKLNKFARRFLLPVACGAALLTLSPRVHAQGTGTSVSDVEADALLDFKTPASTVAKNMGTNAGYGGAIGAAMLAIGLGWAALKKVAH